MMEEKLAPLEHSTHEPHTLTSEEETKIRRQVGQMVMLGFHGTSLEQENCQKVRQLVQEGKVGSLIFFTYNMANKSQTRDLIDTFKKASRELPLLIAVDQEGGGVQRIPEPQFLSPKQVSSTMTPEEAKPYYKELAKVLDHYGFNLNLAPCVDLHQKGSKCIGNLDRSFSEDPRIVVQYAKAFCDAHAEEGIATCLKHFPGHGYATEDSHQGMVDVTETLHNDEQKPFYDLPVLMVMTAHLMHRGYDKKYPVTLSPTIMEALLPKDKRGKKILITDDLHMGAILQHYALEETVLQAILSGHDMLIFSNNSVAAGGVENFKPSLEIPDHVANIVVEAIRTGVLTQDRIQNSYNLIKTYKRSFEPPLGARSLEKS